MTDERAKELKRLENCFLMPTGTIDLMTMSEQLSQSDFREYLEMAREARAAKKK